MVETLKLLKVEQEPVAVAASIASHHVVKIELDDRCFLFPDGKALSHILVMREGRSDLAFDAVFPFNATRRSARFLTLSCDEVRLFTRELLDAVYAAKTGFLLSDTLKISITVVPNGYRIDISKSDLKIELFVSTGVIWRFIRGLLLAVDEASPVVSH